MQVSLESEGNSMAKKEEWRLERDSMGEIKVPADKYWGAQSERSFENFKIGTEKMPMEVIRAFAYLKKSAAQANEALDKLDKKRCQIIGKVCDEILKGKLDGNFPLAVWQTGSGTQSNMNVNEVIAHRGNELAGEALLHPNDHVNMSQSSNDTFPTAMHIAAVWELEKQLLPALDELVAAFKKLEKANKGIVTTGRTHLQDAVPVAFSQEISGWRTMLERNRQEIKAAEKGLLELALGGTAVGALKALAANLMKMANDVRWLASGPRDGLGEITIPANEPGSSIMPGKVNPTQCEAVTMVAVQVMGNDAAIGFAASQGNFQLNVFLPVTIYNFLQSVRLLGDVMVSFRKNCVVGIKANKEKMAHNLHNSLMLVTALSPYIGYDKCAQVAKLAFKENISLKEAVLKLGFMEEGEFDKVFHPEKMV